MSVKGHHEQAAVGSGVEAHALVHDVSVIRFGDGDTLGSLVGRECHYRTAPVSSVGRGDKQCLPRRLLLVNGIGKILQVEFAAPVSYVGSVVVCPAIAFGLFRMASVGSHYLYVLSTDSISEPTVVQTWVADFTSDIAYRLVCSARLGRCQRRHTGQRQHP